MSAEHSFHPAVERWFASAFPEATIPQRAAWPAIQAGSDVLVAAPTGSGKTLAAFLAAIDDLVRQAVAGTLADATQVVYVSPLKALSNDVERNLATPLAGIRDELAAMQLPDAPIRTLVRTGDTTQTARASMRRLPPHILVTTPESLYVLLGSESGRAMLATTRTVIVDEIHAIAGSKRGSHLALSLERLDALCGARPVRIGLSATQKPIEEIAEFLVGTGERRCEIVDAGHIRHRDLAIELPSSPLEAVMSHDVWSEVYQRIADLAASHRTTLVFVNTRRMAERAARHLTDLLGPGQVMSHHGSMAKELRHKAEQRLKNGELKVLCATASLELGIDIGDVDLVIQVGSPRSIATFLQRAGRASHQVGGTPKARIFPLSRDELVECAALLDAVQRGELDRLHIPHAPLDVLAQQIVAEVAAQEWSEQALFDLYRRAYPYRDLAREVFGEILRMLAEGFDTSRGQRAAYLHRDAVNGVLRARKGARITALTSGGAIPDTADYDVLLEPAGQKVGTVNEDFAIESLAGDIFQLGNASYKIRRVEAGRVRVEDAQGQPPTIPFWIGEAPGRTDELSLAVSRLREDVANGDVAQLERAGVTPLALAQLRDYIVAARAALDALPTQSTIVIERFFDESGGMQLVIHSPYGSRINRAWGLALRKRFCLKFNFELQAAATEDAIVLSLSTSHSFDLISVSRYLHSNSVRDVLAQAMLPAPMFTARWRWAASISLALPRFRGGSKVPAQLQRMRADDLMASVFPEQVACADNIVGDREIPDHPLVRQTIDDCFHDAMDLDGLIAVLRGIESGAIRVVARDMPTPSPLSLEVLSAKPYSFLDDAPLEERRTHAVIARRWLDPATAADLGKLDVAAIDRVREEAWPVADNADELHDALMGLGFLLDDEVARGAGWQQFSDRLQKDRRATWLAVSPSLRWLVAAERLPVALAVHPSATTKPHVDVPQEYVVPVERANAVRSLVRTRLEGAGPVTPARLADALGIAQPEVEVALAALAGQGIAMSGRYTPGVTETEWCERGLLARIHRYTVKRLREEIEPVSTQDLMRFLLRWQHLVPAERREGPDALDAVITQLQGFESPAAAWEAEILPARLLDYDFTWLDDLCLSGRVVWTRLTPPGGAGGSGPIRTSPIALLPRRAAALWNRLARPASATLSMSPRAQRIADFLAEHGASFFDEIVDGARMLRTEVEDALGELVATGLVTSDSFAGLRALLTPSEKRKPFGRRAHGRALFGIEDSGRWSLRRRPAAIEASDVDVVEPIVHALLRRYGVVFWKMLQREAAWLPPWRDLLHVLRRLEARGDIRGGRFVAGVSGEQFATPEAVKALRDVRRQAGSGELVAVSGADPLNLTGVILPGAKVPALTGNRIVYRDGATIATLVSGELRWIEVPEPEVAMKVEEMLQQRRAGTPRLAYLR
ncbi:MAG: DEAD/DEAH box helicase [Burkholderiales bacterium]